MRLKTMVPCCVMLLCAAVVVGARTEPPTAADGGAATKNITFSDPPRPATGSYYKSSSAYDERGMHHLYALTQMFQSVVMDKGLPEVFMNEEFLKEPLHYVLNHKSELFREYKLFVTLAAVGIALAVIMPLTGLIICCCRCRKRQDMPESKSDPCKRGVLGLLMFILVVTMLFAIVCAFVTNEHAVDGVHHVPTQLENAVVDIATYFNSTQEDAEYLLVNNFEELVEHIDQELNHIGDRMRLMFSQATDALSISDLLVLVERLDNITALLTSIKTSSESLERDGADLSSKVSQEKTTITTTMNQCQDAVCNAIKGSREFQELKAKDYSQLPTKDVEDLKKNVEKLTSNDIAGKIRTGLNSFNSINETFQKQVTQVSGEINNKIREVGNKLKSMSDNSYKYPISTATIQESVKGAREWINYANEYIGYYRYAGISVACIASVVFLFYSLGLMWGACSSHTGPCSASTGATLFLWGVAIFFLTYAIVQIPITAMYGIGTIVQRAGCDVAVAPDSNTTQRLLQLVAMRLNYNEPLVHFAARSITKCRSGNWSLYRLLQDAEKDNIKIGNVTLRAVDFAAVENYKNEQGLDDKVKELADKLEKSTLNFKLITPEAQKMVEDLKQISFSTVDVQNYLHKVSGSPTLTDLGKFAKQLHSAASAVQQREPQTANELTQSAQRLEDYQRNLVPKLTQEVATLSKQLHDLDKMIVVNGTGIVNVISDTYNRVKMAEEVIKTKGKSFIRSLAMELVDDLKGLVNEYVNHVKHEVIEVMGRCGPLSTAYDASVNSICKGVMLPFNGYWVSIGWCLISGIPAMIIALLLVPLFRRLDPFLIPPSESVNRKARRGGGGRGVYDNRNGYLHDYSPEYRDHHHPQRSITGVTSPSVAYVPAPHYNYTRDPDLPPYKPTHGPTAPPVNDWGHGGSDYHKPPPYYFPGP
ncbi:prominin-1-like isoform X2 [Ornithodoros turicata]|uniref:prominin-1-like isoform X2 n=1 Tax=Ornithodoros turicata TaxID=34597 RepID=UPI003139FC76